MWRWCLVVVIFPFFAIAVVVGLGPWVLRRVQLWHQRRLTKKVARAFEAEYAARQKRLSRGRCRPRGG